jgi:hypothetical protein
VRSVGVGDVYAVLVEPVDDGWVRNHTLRVFLPQFEYETRFTNVGGD